MAHRFRDLRGLGRFPLLVLILLAAAGVAGAIRMKES